MPTTLTLTREVIRTPDLDPPMDARDDAAAARADGGHDVPVVDPLRGARTNGGQEPPVANPLRGTRTDGGRDVE